MLLEPFVPKPDPRYAWTSGVIRSLEKKLLRKIDYQKLIDLNEDEIAQFLNEFGYRGAKSDEMNAQINSLLEFLDKHSNDKQLTDSYRMRWDFKNLTHILKKRMLYIDFTPEDIIPWGLYGFENYLNAIESEKSEIPEFMIDAVEKARYDYDTEQEIWRIGMILDAAYLRYFTSKIPKKNQFLKQYYNILSDQLNVTTAIRFIEFDYVSRDFEEFYVDYGYIDYDFLYSLWETDRSGLVNRFIHTKYGKPLQDAVGDSLSDEDMLPLSNYFLSKRISYLMQSIYSAFGLEVLVAYFEKKRIEIDTLRTLIRVKSGNLEKEHIERTVSYVLL
ncbi:MAG: V-type ATPase subunit [Candidatus Zixiibacteriota bacterium]